MLAKSLIRPINQSGGSIKKVTMLTTTAFELPYTRAKSAGLWLVFLRECRLWNGFSNLSWKFIGLYKITFVSTNNSYLCLCYSILLYRRKYLHKNTRLIGFMRKPFFRPKISWKLWKQFRKNRKKFKKKKNHCVFLELHWK